MKTEWEIRKEIEKITKYLKRGYASMSPEFYKIRKETLEWVLE